MAHRCFLHSLFSSLLRLLFQFHFPLVRVLSGLFSLLFAKEPFFSWVAAFSHQFVNRFLLSHLQDAAERTACLCVRGLSVWKFQRPCLSLPSSDVPQAMSSCGFLIHLLPAALSGLKIPVSILLHYFLNYRISFCSFFFPSRSLFPTMWGPGSDFAASYLFIRAFILLCFGLCRERAVPLNLPECSFCSQRIFPFFTSSIEF